jgi:hypothetical protein
VARLSPDELMADAQAGARLTLDQAIALGLEPSEVDWILEAV